MLWQVQALGVRRRTRGSADSLRTGETVQFWKHELALQMTAFSAQLELGQRCDPVLIEEAQDFAVLHLIAVKNPELRDIDRCSPDCCRGVTAVHRASQHRRATRRRHARNADALVREPFAVDRTRRELLTDGGDELDVLDHRVLSRDEYVRVVPPS